jgi:hypothetical protein
MKYIQIILFSLTLFFAKANEDTIKINCYHEEVFENFCPTCVDTISYEVFTGITVERYDSTFRIYMPYKIYDEDTLTVIQDVYNNTVYVDLDSTAYSDKEDLANAIALCLGDTAVSTGTSGQDSIQWKDEYVDKGTKGGIKNVNFRGTNLTAADSLDWLNVTALIQQISITGTKGTIRLDNNGLYVVLGDSSSVNEGSLSFSVSANEGTIISNTLGSNTGYFNGRGILNLTDSSGHWLFTATESQTLSFSNPTLSISGGNSVNISAINTDNQYIDTFMIVGNYLKISVYGDNKRLDSVSLAAYLDNTDAQNLSYNSSTHAIDIVGGTSAVIPIASASPLTTGLITGSDMQAFSNKQQAMQWKDEYTNKGGLGGIVSPNFIGSAVTAVDSSNYLNITISALSNSTSSTQDGYFGDIYLRDDTSPSHYLRITDAENLTADRVLSISVINANRVLSMQGDLTVSSTASISGSNTGDQTITLTGDVTGSGTGSFAATIANDAVTLAKMANVATSTVFYRKTAGTGDPETQTLATLKTDLGLTGTNSGDQTITLTGHVTGSGTGSFATTIASNVVTSAMIVDATVANADLANMANKTVKGRNSAGTGVPEDVTFTQFMDWVGSAAQGDILYRGSSSWSRLAASTSGYVLNTNGTGANPSWGIDLNGIYSGGNLVPNHVYAQFNPVTNAYDFALGYFDVYTFFHSYSLDGTEYGLMIYPGTTGEAYTSLFGADSINGIFSIVTAGANNFTVRASNNSFTTYAGLDGQFDHAELLSINGTDEAHFYADATGGSYITMTDGTNISSIEFNSTNLHLFSNDGTNTSRMRILGDSILLESKKEYIKTDSLKIEIQSAFPAAPYLYELKSDVNNTATFQSEDFPFERKYEYINDFVGYVFPDGTLYNNTSCSGGGMSSADTDMTTAMYGEADQSTGTSSNCYNQILTQNTVFTFGHGVNRYVTRIGFDNLSSGTQRYQYLCGFLDTYNGTINQENAAYFLYDDGGVSTGSASSANWQCVTVDSFTRTFTTTSTAVTTSYQKLEIISNATGTSIDFIINGSVVATHTTNIPNVNTRRVGFGSIIKKSIGTTSRRSLIDYIYVKADLNNSR